MLLRNLNIMRKLVMLKQEEEEEIVEEPHTVNVIWDIISSIAIDDGVQDDVQEIHTTNEYNIRSKIHVGLRGAGGGVNQYKKILTLFNYASTIKIE